jgi:putative DNA primase/helicase
MAALRRSAEFEPGDRLCRSGSRRNRNDQDWSVETGYHGATAKAAWHQGRLIKERRRSLGAALSKRAKCKPWQVFAFSPKTLIFARWAYCDMDSHHIDLRALHAVLGGEISCGQVLCPGPYHSKADRSLAVKPTASGGFVVHSFAGDDWQLCRDFVREKLGLPRWNEDKPLPRRPWTQPQTDSNRQNVARRLWDEAGDPRVPFVIEYFKSRGLDLPEELCDNPLRFHPRGIWRTADRIDFIPCLIACFRSIATDEVTAVTRIRLDEPERWPRVERKMLGDVRDAAIKLDPITERRLCVAEGLESALAARQLGFSPVWALGSARRLMPINGVDELIILGEHDDANRKAADGCFELWEACGKKVMLALPAIGNGDFNDALMATGAC